MAIARPTLLNPGTAGEQGTGERARFDEKQNGKVAIYRIVDEHERQRDYRVKNSEGRTIEIKEKGEIFIRPATLNATKYEILLTREGGILERVRDYFGPDVVVSLQEDGAPPHGRVTRNTNGRMGTHERLVAETKTRNMNLVRQPPNSPELNACDLGVWHALKKKVSAKNLPDTSWKHTHAAQERLWKAIEEAWGELEPKSIFNVFEVRTEVAKILKENHGGVLNQEPHAGVRQKWGTQ